ncbi:glycoside hydrolase family 18 protein, partial [Periconia macrospinosa]
VPIMFTRAISVAATLAATVSAGFNAGSNSNVAIYWGQGDAQITLPEVCSDASVDIVNLAFVNEFPTAIGEYPGNNFANACEPDKYTLNGKTTKLSSNCPLIGPGIQKCHENGKKVFLSLGGGLPTNYSLPSQELAEYFADFLWGAFGPLTAEWEEAGKPRPFGDVSVDGFDLDLEAWIEGAPFNEYQYINYDHFVNRLRSNYASSGGEYYISGAPQCTVPDSRMAYAIERSHFDFLFVQFYNTLECNTRRGYEGLGKDTTDFTFDAWVKWLNENSANQNTKIYLGMPASSTAALSDPTAYLTPTEAEKLINAYRTAYPTKFGGVMLWEVMRNIRNPICGKPYSTYIRSILD